MSGKTATRQVRGSDPEPSETAPAVPESETEPSTTGSETATTERDGLRVPIPTLGVRMTRVPLPPGPRTVAAGASSATAAVRRRVPDGQSLLYYGGLGVAAAAGLVSWPVAAAIGAGVWVAERTRQDSSADR
ncbi:hypothetical protein OHA40_00165 [Nocardia sp. NBC_00508]|uniref:hypothetical protein n=1 Tax=Nocardia sp. NBC_00508 TaxID=2975992 RepID=UPI002E815AD2|nr:hypothetical protein [Nocardia sp. NBC_00508]WUD66635.1 hypothetical protein OHA40_00165 [Nocardia sp. NBC_00508]